MLLYDAALVFVEQLAHFIGWIALCALLVGCLLLLLPEPARVQVSGSFGRRPAHVSIGR